MLDVVEPRHIAAILSPFDWGDDAATAPNLAAIASQFGAPSGQPILLSLELQPDFELARRRLLDETV